MCSAVSDIRVRLLGELQAEEFDSSRFGRRQVRGVLKILARQLAVGVPQGAPRGARSLPFHDQAIVEGNTELLDCRYCRDRSLG